jgi:hypothetical protein
VKTNRTRWKNAETSVIEANRDLEIAKAKEAELHIYRAENSNRITGYNRTIGEIKQKLTMNLTGK